MYYNLDKIDFKQVVKVNGVEHTMVDVKVKDYDFVTSKLTTFEGQKEVVNKFFPSINFDELTTLEYTALLIAIKEGLMGDKVNLQQLVEQIRE
jgi:predicted DNA binding protein